MPGQRTLSTSLADAAEEQRVVLHGVPWEQYVALLRTIGDKGTPRTAYLDGELEIMTHGWRHEWVKKLLARLVEAYADAADISLNGFGNKTFKRKMKRAGCEPDECYIVGPRKSSAADFAIEVVVTSGDLDKLEIYRRVGIREVWFWEDGKLSVHVLGEDGSWRAMRRSPTLPGFPIAMAERTVIETDESHQSEAVRQFRKSLEAGRARGS
jgi:Uma2 family endonuclease